jgi:hypothetical protein
MTTPADDTPNELAAALERIQQLEHELWKHIRVYLVDDQHPDPDAEAHRIMQREVRGRPEMTIEKTSHE